MLIQSFFSTYIQQVFQGRKRISELLKQPKYASKITEISDYIR